MLGANLAFIHVRKNSYLCVNLVGQMSSFIVSKKTRSLRLFQAIENTSTLLKFIFVKLRVTTRNIVKEN